MLCFIEAEHTDHKVVFLMCHINVRLFCVSLHCCFLFAEHVFSILSKGLVQSSKIPNKSRTCNIIWFIDVLQTFCPGQNLNNEMMWMFTKSFIEGKLYTGSLWGNVTQKPLWNIAVQIGCNDIYCRWSTFHWNILWEM